MHASHQRRERSATPLNHLLSLAIFSTRLEHVADAPAYYITAASMVASASIVQCFIIICRWPGIFASPRPSVIFIVEKCDYDDVFASAGGGFSTRRPISGRMIAIMLVPSSAAMRAGDKHRANHCVEIAIARRNRACAAGVVRGGNQLRRS